MKTKLNLIHISDLHFGKISQTDPKINKVHDTFYTLSKKISDINKKDKIDYLIVSGDIGFSGGKDDYKKSNSGKIKSASDFFRLFEKGELFPESIKVIICPGNHDVFHPDFDSSKPDISKAKVRYEKYENVVSHGRPNSILFKELMGHFKNFTDFYKKGDFVKLESPFREKNSLMGYFHDKSTETVFVVLNSAWLSDPNWNDIGKLKVGKEIVSSIYSEIKGLSPKLVITIMHHPFYFLRWDKRFGNPGITIPIFQEITRFSEILLVGHEHCNILPPDKLLNRSFSFITGATFEKPKDKDSDFYYNAFQYISIDLENKSLQRNICEAKNNSGSYEWRCTSDNIIHFETLTREREGSLIRKKTKLEFNRYLKLKEIDSHNSNPLIINSINNHYYYNFTNLAHKSKLFLDIKNQLGSDFNCKVHICFPYKKHSKEQVSQIENELRDYISVNRCIIEQF